MNTTENGLKVLKPTSKMLWGLSNMDIMDRCIIYFNIFIGRVVDNNSINREWGMRKLIQGIFLFLFIKECGILIMSMGSEEYLIYIYLKYIFIIKNLFFII